MQVYEDFTVPMMVGIICDCCKTMSKCVSIENYISLDFVAGYSSIFGDGSQVRGDFCHQCVQDLLDKYLEVLDG